MKPYVAALLLAAPLPLTPGCKQNAPTASLSDTATAYGLGVVSNGVTCPSTVKFLTVECWQKVPGLFVVEGTMDTQNTYGAMVRERFACGVTNENGMLYFTVANAGQRYWTPTNLVDLTSTP